MSRGTGRTPTRERFREQVREDIKAVGLAQLAKGGPQALSLAAIAKELGVSGPALYRYFSSRDGLLAALVLDAYGDLAQALDHATRPELGLSPVDGLLAFGHAWRAWAIGQPHRYSLLFAPPLPGWDAHAPDVVAAAHRSMSVLLRVLALLVPPSVPSTADLTTAVQTHADLLADRHTDPAHLRWAVHVWSRLHGMVSLEIGGNFDSPFLDIDPEALFADELAYTVGVRARPGPS